MLVLERRGFVGGAAITEELHPGFSFTTFSYALSLLRPEIIQELELVKHGFMPLLMPTHFAPMDDGDYLLLTEDEQFNDQEIAPAQQARRRRLPPLGARPREGHPAGHADVQRAPPDIFSDDPADQADVAWMVKQLRGADRKTLHDLVRFLTGSCADLLDDYFESDIIKASIASSGIIGNKVGPMSQGSGLVLLYHLMGEQDGHHGAWGFHKGGNGGFTQVLQRAAESFGATVRLEAPVDHVITKDGRATGVVLTDGTEFSAPIVVSALDPRRTFTELVDPRELPERPERGDRPLPLPGHLGQGELRPRRPAGLPGAEGPDRPLRRLRQHRAVDRVPRAGLRRRQVRLVLPACPTSTVRSSRWSTPTWRLRAST